jgi:hypothetical protein
MSPNSVEMPSLFQAINTPEWCQIQNKTMQTVRCQHGVCVVYHYLHLAVNGTPEPVCEYADKTVARGMKYAQLLLHCNHTLWIYSISNSPDLAWFLKSEGTNCANTLYGKRKNVPPSVETIKLKRQNHFGPHSDVAVLACRIKDKVESSPSTYHTDEMHQ